LRCKVLFGANQCKSMFNFGILGQIRNFFKAALAILAELVCLLAALLRTKRRTTKNKLLS
jgi:hypothetical protein